MGNSYNIVTPQSVAPPDIHLYAEVKFKGKWEFAGELDFGRNYDIFARMADCGRRPDTKPLADNRGIPEDAAELTKYMHDEYGEQGHSHSWLNVEEIKKILEEFPQIEAWKMDQGYEVNCFFSSSWASPGDYGYKAIEDVRWVFWFDN